MDTLPPEPLPRKKRKHRPYATLSAQAKKTRNRANKRRLKRRAAELAAQ